MMHDIVTQTLQNALYTLNLGVKQYSLTSMGSVNLEPLLPRSCVCLSVCLSTALTFESLDVERSFLVSEARIHVQNLQFNVHI